MNMRDWLSKNSNGFLQLFGLLIVVVGIDFAPAWLGEKLSTLAQHVGADPEGSVSVFLVLVGGLASAVGLLRAAWQRDPNTATQTTAQRPTKTTSSTSGHAHVLAMIYTAAAGLAFAAGCSLLAGCGASSAETVPLVIGGAEIVVGGLCTGAEKLCEQNDPACGSGACHVAHTVCPVLSPSSPVQIACNALPAVTPAAP